MEALSLTQNLPKSLDFLRISENQARASFATTRGYCGRIRLIQASLRPREVASVNPLRLIQASLRPRDVASVNPLRLIQASLQPRDVASVNPLRVVGVESKELISTEESRTDIPDTDRGPRACLGASFRRTALRSTLHKDVKLPGVVGMAMQTIPYANLYNR